MKNILDYETNITKESDINYLIYLVLLVFLFNFVMSVIWTHDYLSFFSSLIGIIITLFLIKKQ